MRYYWHNLNKEGENYCLKEEDMKNVENELVIKLIITRMGEVGRG